MWNQEQQIIKSQISSNEQICWVGRPKQGFFFRPSDAWGIPFTLLYFGFLAFLSFHFWSSGSDLFLKLFGIIFIIFGLYFLIGRFFVDLLQRKKTFYGITNERIVIVCGVFSQETKYIDLEGLTETSIEENPNGYGTITFGRDEINDSNNWFYSNDNDTNVIYAPKFKHIPNAKNVHEIIRNAQKLLR
jgi:Bacterial PH domain